MQKMNFYPPLYILALVGMVVGAIAFFDVLIIYVSANITLNTFIIGNFLVCCIWIVGVLTYFKNSYAKIKIFVDSMIGGGTPAPVALAGTVFDNPIMNQVMTRAEREGTVKVTRTEIDAILSDVTSKAMSVSSWPRFMTGVFVMLGLFGTFIGLLQTIGGVGAAFSALGSNTDIAAFVQLLAQPLQGMAVAFSSSLFGLVGSLFTSLGVYLVNQKLAKMNDGLGTWLEDNISMFIPGIDPDSPLNVMAQVFDHVIGRLEQTFVDRFDNLAVVVGDMANIMSSGSEMQQSMLEAVNRMAGTQDLDTSLHAVADAITEQTQTLSRQLERQAMDQYNSMNDFIKSTSEFLQSLRAGVGEAFGAVNVGLQSMDKTLNTLEEGMRVSSESMTRASTESNTAIQQFTRLMETSVEGVRNIQQATGAVSTGMRDVEAVLSGLSRVVEGVSGTMTSAIDSVAESARASQGTYRDVAQLFSEGINAMVQSNDTIFQAQREILNASNKSIELQSTITGALDMVFKSTATMEAMVKSMTDIVSAMQKGIETTSQLVTNSNAIIEKAVSMPERMTESFNTGLTSISKQNTEFLAGLKPNFDKFAEDAEKLLGTSTTFQQSSAATMETIKSAITEVSTSVSSLSKGNTDVVTGLNGLLETSRTTGTSTTAVLQALTPLRDIQQAIAQLASKNVDLSPLERLMTELTRQLTTKIDDLGRVVSSTGFNPEPIINAVQAINGNIQNINRPLEGLARLVDAISQQLSNSGNITAELAPIQRTLVAIGDELRAQSTKQVSFDSTPVVAALRPIAAQLESINNKQGNLDMAPVVAALRPITAQLESINNKQVSLDMAPVVAALQPITEQLESINNKQVNLDIAPVVAALQPIAMQLESMKGNQGHLESITAGIAIVSNQVKDLIAAINKVVETNDTAGALLPSMEGIVNSNNAMAMVLDKIQTSNEVSAQSLVAIQEALVDAARSVADVKVAMASGNESLVGVKDTINDTLENIRDVITQISESVVVMQNSIKER